MNTRELVLLGAGVLFGSGLTLLITMLVIYRPTLRRQLKRSSYIPPSIEGRRNQKRYARLQKRVNKKFDNSLVKMQKAFDKYSA